MADEEAAKPKKSSKVVLFAAILAIALGGGSFYAVHSGLVLGPQSADEKAEKKLKAKDLPPVAFIDVDPLLVNLGHMNPQQHLRFEASLEVEPEYSSDVQVLMPRIVDVLNSYLRAVETNDLTDPSALVRLRAQMLRRIQMVTGEGRVRDLLVSKFLVS